MTNPPTGEPFGGADAVPVELEPHEAAAGVDKTVTLPGGRTSTVRIPSGVTDNVVLRLPDVNVSDADMSDPDAPTDLLIRVLIKPSGPVYATYPPTSAPPGLPAPAAMTDLPTGTTGFPATAPPGSWTPPAQPPTGPAPVNRGLIAGVVAGVIVLLLLCCGGGGYLATRIGGKNTSANANATDASTRSAAPSPTKPPVSPEEYSKILAGVDAALGPAIQQVAAGHNPEEVSLAVSAMRAVAMMQASVLGQTGPPEQVKSAHDDFIVAMGAFATTLDGIGDAAQGHAICSGSAAMARLSSALSADQLSKAAQAYVAQDPAHAYKVGTFLPGPSAEQNRRLGNGTFVKKGNRTGAGTLKIDNGGTTEDTAISLVPANTKTTSFTVYVHAGGSFTVRGIRDGTYQVNLTTGVDWDPAAPGFSRSCAFSRFTDPIEFKTTSRQYTEWEITMNASTGGNARTDDVAPQDFPTA
jgi:hypothetical protein